MVSEQIQELMYIDTIKKFFTNTYHAHLPSWSTMDSSVDCEAVRGCRLEDGCGLDKGSSGPLRWPSLDDFGEDWDWEAAEDKWPPAQVEVDSDSLTSSSNSLISDVEVDWNWKEITTTITLVMWSTVTLTDFTQESTKTVIRNTSPLYVVFSVPHPALPSS